MTLLIPSVLKCKIAHEYVGGVEVWKALIEHYGDKLPVFRRTPRGDTYFRRETIDKVIQLAEIEGKLLFDAAKVGKLPESKNGRKRLTTVPEDSSSTD